ncbi:MAG TPA: amidase domain-containing protein [Oscillospiraceae bacterium]|nr:amidase domain-containing protein [Oscillospiraceae bacterium]
MLNKITKERKRGIYYVEIKKIVSMFLAVIMIISMGYIGVFAETNNSAHRKITSKIDEAGTFLLKNLLAKQGESFKTGIEVDTSDIFHPSESTELYKQYLNWYIGSTNALGTYWTEYNYDLKLDNISNNELTFSANLEYGRIVSISQSANYDYFYKISLIDVDGQYYIKSIDTNEVNYSSFIRLVFGETTSANLSNINDRIQALISDSYELKAQFDSIEINEELVVDMEKIHNEYEANEQKTKGPLAAYSYNGENGRNYADKYHASYNPYFYVASGNDCTNWVSQCIWAAYGGWSENDTNAVMQANINNGKRMMAKTSYSNWFAGSGGGGGPWENVSTLWNFTTGLPSTGPKATGVNNNSTYNNIHPSAILTGQVLQFKNGSSGNYGHSAYVSGGVNDTYANIWVTQHSSSVSRQHLDEVILGWGSGNCYMRQLKFATANFDK